MNLKDIVAVSGLAGLFRMVTNKNNGLIIADMDTGKTRFASVRKHQFTPLGTVAIYTDTDSTPIADVFQQMTEKTVELPIPSPKGKPGELFAYFSEILPDYDRDRVLISDVKKVIKWYLFLASRDLLPTGGAEEEE